MEQIVEAAARGVSLYFLGITLGRFLSGFASMRMKSAALIRLGYYNVMEMAQKNVDKSGQRFFRGLPVTSIAIILPIFEMSTLAG